MHSLQSFVEASGHRGTQRGSIRARNLVVKVPLSELRAVAVLFGTNTVLSKPSPVTQLGHIRVCLSSDTSVLYRS